MTLPPPPPPPPGGAPALGPPPPEIPAPRLDDRERRLDPDVVTVWRIFGGLGLAMPLTGAAIAGAVLFAPARWLAPALALVVLVVGITWYPRARYRRWRWQLTDLALELRYGILVRRHEAVPYFRIQQIDITQGPVDRLVGLATLEVTTASASGSAALPGIAADDAPGVRQELLARAAAALEDHPDEARDAV